MGPAFFYGISTGLAIAKGGNIRAVSQILRYALDGKWHWLEIQPQSGVLIIEKNKAFTAV
jgi:hypothetical protein